MDKGVFWMISPTVSGPFAKNSSGEFRHILAGKKAGMGLPDIDEPIVDFFAAEISSLWPG